MTTLYANHAPAPKLKVNLKEHGEVVAAIDAFAPTTPAEAELALKTVRATGPLVGKCYIDEVAYERPRLLARVQANRMNVSYSEYSTANPA